MIHGAAGESNRTSHAGHRALSGRVGATLSGKSLIHHYRAGGHTAAVYREVAIRHGGIAGIAS